MEQHFVPTLFILPSNCWTPRARYISVFFRRERY